MGRGCAATRGESCGRGNKGQKKRFKVPPYFEGGQTPLYRRIPKRGFNRTAGEEYSVVNVDELHRFEADEKVTPEKLAESGLVRDPEAVKLLGRGEIELSLEIEVHAVSSSAREKVEEAGGSVTILTGEQRG